jgi:two-component system, cell cycle sensor histidine kinase and response regulator CckA
MSNPPQKNALDPSPSSALEETRLAAERYRLLFDNNPVPMWAYDTETLRFLAVNDAAVRTYGYAREEFLAMTICDVRPPDDAAVLAERVRVLPKGFNQTGKWRHRRKDGTVFPVEITSHSLVFDGHDARLVLITDITERQRAEEALRKSEKLAAIGQLISGVAHELNNPLSSILILVETLLQDVRPLEDTEALTTIRDQARRSRAIVRDLLSSARGGPVRRQMTSVADLLQRTARGLAPQVEELGGELQVAVGDSLPELSMDPTAIAQVITNLVVNAAQAAKEGGRIRLRGLVNANRLEIVVEDNGPGIAPDDFSRLFEPFFTTKPPGLGTGLGLAVSRGIVEVHQGTLMAENLPGGGARFTLSLPLPETAAETAVGATASTAPVGEGARRVLIIDDEPSIRMALRRFFTKRDWLVDEASDGGAALRALLAPDAPDYTLVVSDLKMPGLSGIALHDRLIAERPGIVSRMIFSTGDVASADAREFIDRVRAPVLQKPFELAMLDETITRCTR